MVPEQLPFSHPVVLYVDADEEMTPALAREIRASLPRFEAGAGGAFVPFDYVFCGRKLRHGHRVYKLALLARDRSRFLDYDDLDVAHMWEVEGHYQPQVQGQTFALREPMVHNDHDSLFHYFDKHNRYSDWEASLRVKGLMNDPREANLGGRALLNGCSTRCRSGSISFLHSYVFRLGFLDGKAGFDYAVARAMYYWQIRIKTEEIRKARQACAEDGDDKVVAGAANDPRPSVPRGPDARGGCRGCDGCGACLATRRGPRLHAAAAGPVRWRPASAAARR